MLLRAAMPLQSRQHPCEELIHSPRPRGRPTLLGRPGGVLILSDFPQVNPYQRATAVFRNLAFMLSLIGLTSLAACMPPPSGLNLSLDRPTVHDKYHVAIYPPGEPIAINKLHAFEIRLRSPSGEPVSVPCRWYVCLISRVRSASTAIPPSLVPFSRSSFVVAARLTRATGLVKPSLATSGPAATRPQRSLR